MHDPGVQLAGHVDGSGMLLTALNSPNLATSLRLADVQSLLDECTLAPRAASAAVTDAALISALKPLVSEVRWRLTQLQLLLPVTGWIFYLDLLAPVFKPATTSGKEDFVDIDGSLQEQRRCALAAIDGYLKQAKDEDRDCQAVFRCLRPVLYLTQRARRLLCTSIREELPSLDVRELSSAEADSALVRASLMPNTIVFCNDGDLIYDGGKAMLSAMNWTTGRCNLILREALLVQLFGSPDAANTRMDSDAIDLAILSALVQNDSSLVHVHRAGLVTVVGILRHQQQRDVAWQRKTVMERVQAIVDVLRAREFNVPAEVVRLTVLPIVCRLVATGSELYQLDGKTPGFLTSDEEALLRALNHRCSFCPAGADTPPCRHNAAGTVWLNAAAAAAVELTHPPSASASTSTSASASASAL